MHKKRKPTVKKDGDFQWYESLIIQALAEAHPSPSWVFLHHVSNATSFDRTRSADAMAMGCWNSVGISLHGFEVKISRADWLREIQDVAKAEAFTRYCHYWWVVAPEDVVKIEEMPNHWGLKCISRRADGTSSFRVQKAATFNAAAEIDFAFFASILRNAKSNERRDEMDTAELINDAYGRGEKAGEARWRKLSEGTTNNNADAILFSKLREQVHEFELSSGIKFDGYRPGEKIGQAIKFYMEMGDPAEVIRRLERDIRYIVRGVERAKLTFNVKSEDDDDL